MSYGQPFITELKASVNRLTKEVEKLNGKLAEKADEITDLKKAAKKSTTKKTPTKKPALDKFGVPKIVSIEALTESSDSEEKLDS